MIGPSSLSAHAVGQAMERVEQPDTNPIIPKFSGLSWDQAISIGREALRNHISLCPRDQIAMTIEACPEGGLGGVRAACPYCSAFVIAARAV